MTSTNNRAVFAVDVNQLRQRACERCAFGVDPEGRTLQKLEFSDGFVLVLVNEPLPANSRNFADCIDREDPDHKQLLKEHSLWRLAEEWRPVNMVPVATEEIAGVREITREVKKGIPFAQRFACICAAHLADCSFENITPRLIVDAAEQLFVQADMEMLDKKYDYKLMSPEIIRQGNAMIRRLLAWSSRGFRDWPLLNLCWAQQITGPDGHYHRAYKSEEDAVMSSSHITQMGNDNGMNPKWTMAEHKPAMVFYKGRRIS